MFLTVLYKFFITIAVFSLCHKPTRASLEYYTDEENILLDSNLYEKLILTKSYRPSSLFFFKMFKDDDFKEMGSKSKKFIKRDDDSVQSVSSDNYAGGGTGANTALRNDSLRISMKPTSKGQSGRRDKLMNELFSIL